MSQKYDEYLKEHITNVVKAFNWFKEYMPTLFLDENDMNEIEHQITTSHDKSKFTQEEYEAYDKYFYGGNKSYDVIRNFNNAWLHHIHNNPHHWQHWVLLNDEPDEGEIFLEMPDNYIIEMICDWWSFSWKKGDLTEIFSWYNERKDYIKLGPDTREKVEGILESMKKIFNDKLIVVKE